jgi:hypothetical protein
MADLEGVCDITEKLYGGMPTDSLRLMRRAFVTDRDHGGDPQFITRRLELIDRILATRTDA